MSPFPHYTAAARKRWKQIPEQVRLQICQSVWCGTCGMGSPMQVRTGEMKGNCLILRGVCKKCGRDMARLIEPE